MKKIPNLIKEYCKIIYNTFQQEPQSLIDFIEMSERGPTDYTLKEFLKVYNDHHNLDSGPFCYFLFKDFCLPRQENIIVDRRYIGTEKILFYETENEVTAIFSHFNKFEPVNVLRQDKLTNNLKKILIDLCLIANEKLTEDGKKIVEEYNA